MLDTAAFTQLADLVEAPIPVTHHLEVTTSPREAAELLARHGLAPRRALGQNFVVDPNTVRRIARLAGVGPGDRVVEIGAGLGALTAGAGRDRGRGHRRRGRRRAGAACCASEVARPRRARRGGRRPHARLDGAAGAGGPAGRSWPTCPTTSPRRWWPTCSTACPPSSRMLVMVQREVGERLAAGPGTTAYGAVSVKVAYWATAAVVGRVPADGVPAPAQGGVGAGRHQPPAGAGRRHDVDRAGLFALVRAGFGQRRKMLRRSLAGLVRAEAFAAAGVRPEARAEELAVRGLGPAGGGGQCT